MLHLGDRFVALVFAELGDAPMLELLGVQEILVDRGQLVAQDRIEKLEYLRVTLHGTFSRGNECVDCRGKSVRGKPRLALGAAGIPANFDRVGLREYLA